MAKLLICVSHDQASVAVWRRNRLASCTRFDNNEAGWNAFGNFLRGAKGLPVHIMVDTVEEDFRFETLPHVRGSERSEMVARKLKQLYRSSSYHSYAFQERGTGTRKDDRYLFAALTDAGLLTPWLQAIETAQLPVSGIYPLALVSASLIDRLRIKQPNLLIVSKNVAGLRQTFFKDLKFRISRLTPVLSAAGMADQHYADEIANTRMYLDALTVTHVDDTLELVILDQDGSLSGLPATIKRGRPNIHCQYLDINAIHTRFGIPISDLRVSTDTLHLFLLGEKAPALNLAPAQITRTYQRFAAGRWVYAASGAMLAGAVLWSGANVYRAMGIDDDAFAAQRQAQDLQSKYQQVVARFPEAPTSAENLRHTVQFAEQIRSRLRTPDAMLAVVSQALTASPDIELQALEWHYGDSTPQKATAGSAPSPGFDALIQTGIVRAEVARFAGDYRAAMSSIQNFLQRIAQDKAVAEVKVLKLPLDIASSSGLNGSTQEIAGKDTAQFEIAISFRSAI